MSDIKTPLTRHDALALALNCAPSVDADDVADALMAVDVASREQSGAAELLEILKIVSPVLNSVDDLVDPKGSRLGPMVDAVIARADNRR